jgi:hypothetical protein
MRWQKLKSLQVMSLPPGTPGLLSFMIWLGSS